MTTHDGRSRSTKPRTPRIDVSENTGMAWRAASDATASGASSAAPVFPTTPITRQVFTSGVSAVGAGGPTPISRTSRIDHLRQVEWALETLQAIVRGVA